MIFDPSETMLMATKKLAKKIPESDGALSAGSAGRVMLFLRTLLDAVAQIKSAPPEQDLGRALAQSVRGALIPILDTDNPLTLSLTRDSVVANNVNISHDAANTIPQELKQILLGHNAKSLTFRLGIDQQEIELLLNAFAHRANVHVGFLWPVWLGENDIKNIYVEQEVQTARLIREGEGPAVSFAGMGTSAASARAPQSAGRTAGPASAEGEEGADRPQLAPRLGLRQAQKAPADEGVAQFLQAPAKSIMSKKMRDNLYEAFDTAMANGDREALASLVDNLKVCLTDASIEVRLYAGTLVDAILPRCVTHKCEYLEDMMVGILCEVLIREADARAYGRLARIASDAANRTLQRGDYDAVRRLVGAFNRPESAASLARTIRAQQLSALQQLLNSGFFDLLLDDLASGNPERTSAANFVLASFDDLVVPRAVRTLTESESLRVRLAAVSVLKAHTSAALAHIKEHFLTATHATALKRIVSALGEMLPESRNLIRTALDHPSEDVATEAVGALLKLPPQEYVEEMAALLKHPRPIVRLEALRLIGDMRITEGEDAVKGMLSSSSPEVSREACIALGKLGSTSSVPSLCGMLRRKGFLGLFGGVSPAVRAAAAWSLGQIRDPRALPYLRKAVSDRNAIVQDTAKLALQSIETGP
jgi:HEAT repeat protein